jgi:hypothetical protein
LGSDLHRCTERGSRKKHGGSSGSDGRTGMHIDLHGRPPETAVELEMRELPKAAIQRRLRFPNFFVPSRIEAAIRLTADR